MVGSRFCELWHEPENLIKADLNGNPDVDITDKGSVSNLFENYSFSTCILFSAYTDVDGAETQRGDKNGICWKINVDGVKNVVKNCKKKNVKLVFISTDFVFDGENGPYGEDDITGSSAKKTSWYGISKIEGEREVAQELKEYIILRISYPYRTDFPAKDDLLRRILKAYKSKELYPMFEDQQLSPTFIDDLSPAVEFLLSKNQTGIFHLASLKMTTPYELAKKLIATFGGNPSEVKPGSIVEYLKSGDKTPRAVKGGLKVDKIIKLGFTPTTWDQGIKIIFEQSQGEII